MPGNVLALETHGDLRAHPAVDASAKPGDREIPGIEGHAGETILLAEADPMRLRGVEREEEKEVATV